jgi:hypothetical protein
MKMNINTDIRSATDTGLVRERNEDNCGTAETPNGTVCVVCDGMGGHVTILFREADGFAIQDNGSSIETFLFLFL